MTSQHFLATCTHWHKEQDTWYHDHEAGASEDARVQVSKDADHESTDERNNVRVVEDVYIKIFEVSAKNLFTPHHTYICWR